MKIEKLSLKNFRNYSNLDVRFNDKLNLIIGDNAQGKTNILEAIYYLSITKSFLVVNDKNIIKKNEVFTSLKGYICDSNGSKKLSLKISENNKKLEINDNEIKKHYDYIGNLKVVIFTPDSIRLLKDSPGNRRKFLNIEISQLYVKYITTLNEFNVVLKQRNEYLKYVRNGRYNEIYLKILNDKFVELAVYIYKYRDDFINKLNMYIGKIYKEISGYDGLYIKYLKNIDIDTLDNMKKGLFLKLENNFDREVSYGSSLIGPHRDDFCFLMNDNDLLIYGSQGQQKMAVLALKLAETNVFFDICEERPVLLLDDLFSELDISKRNMVLDYLNSDMQTIITTTDVDNIDSSKICDSYIYKIKNGEVIYKNFD